MFEDITVSDGVPLPAHRAGMPEFPFEKLTIVGQSFVLPAPTGTDLKKFATQVRARAVGAAKAMGCSFVLRAYPGDGTTTAPFVRVWRAVQRPPRAPRKPKASKA